MKHKKLITALFCASTMTMGAGLLAACGVETDHTHAWKWQSDADEHWQICEEDSTEKEGSRGAHIDANEDGKCDTCERAMTPVPPQHTHDWKWKSDDDEHWQICEADSTEREGSRGAHIDANEDGKCDTCERAMTPVTPEHTHDWKWKSDDEEHWQICEADSTERDGSRGPHIDENEDGKCDTCEHELPQTEDLFSADYIGTWEFKQGNEVMGTLEIEANAAKLSDTPITVTKATDEEGYTFTAGDYDYSFVLSSDKYALLLTADGFTMTMLRSDFDATEDPGFISAPTDHTGTWINAGEGFTLSITADGDIFLDNDPIIILTIDEDESHATALIPHENTYWWAEIYFDTTEISMNIAGMDTFTFTQAPVEEEIEFPLGLRGDWTEIGGERIISITKRALTFNDEDVTATAYVEYLTVYFATEDGESYELNITSDEYVLYVTKDGETKKTLFLNDTAPSLKLAGADALKGKTFTPASVANTLGDLAVATDGTLTLGSKATQVLSTTYDDETSALTAFTFICDGMWYRAIVEDAITLTDLNNKTYKFDGAELTDLSAYAGTWKAFFTATATPNDITITITATEFNYNGAVKKCYQALDGSIYYKDGAFQTHFGFLDEEKTIFYIGIGAGWFFNATGTIPTVENIPEAFRGNWTSDNYFGLTISASSIAVDGKAYTPFAVTGEEGEEAIHAITDNNGYVIFTMGQDAAGEDAVLMGNGSMTLATFSAVKPEPLPEGYQGEWHALSGSDTITVNAEGTFTYNGKVYPTTIDDHDGSYHFTTDAGDVATIELSSDGYVIWIDDGNGTVTYFTQNALTALPDIKMTAFKDTTWSSMALGGATLTFDADGAATIEGKKVQILTQEPDNADTIGTLIYDNTWYDFRITATTITFIGHDGEIIFTKQGSTQTTFTAPDEMIGTWNQIGSGYGMTVEIGEDTVTVGSEKLTDLSATANTITGQWSGTPCTITLMDENTIYVSVSDMGAFFFAKDGTESLPLTEIAGRSWEEDTLGTFTVDEDGNAKLGGKTVYISTVAMGGLDGDILLSFTVVTEDKWYEVEINEDTLIFTDTEDNEYTFIAPGSRIYADELCGEWILKTFLAPESKGGTSPDGPQYTLTIEANKLTWGGVIISSTDETDGKYSFTTTSPIGGGSDETTYTFWLQGDDILLLDDGENTYALFRSTWENNLETTTDAQLVPSEIPTGKWTGANGEELNISTESDSDTGHEAYITVRSKGLDGNPVWLFAGATATLCKGYCRPDGPSHYVYVEMSLSDETLTVKLYFKFAAPETYTFTQKPVEEPYTTPVGMRDTWTLFANGALDSSHTIVMTRDSIKYDDAAVTGVTVDDDIVTFTASDGKTYTAKLDESEYVLCLQAEGEDTYTMYISSLLDGESTNAGVTLKGTKWTGEKGDLEIAADGSATLDGKAVFGIDESHIGVTSFTFVADGMLYVAKLSGDTLTLTDIDGNTYTYTKA